MENCCTPKCIATKLLIFGIILLISEYNGWNTWMVIGVLLIIKAVIMYIMPKCCCNLNSKDKKRK